MNTVPFRFKQFDIHQCEHVMKVNTDGVLLAAHVECSFPKRILDIGTGTGLVALMLAQRFGDALVDAIDSNVEAAKCAERNFRESPFTDNLRSYAVGFEEYCPSHPYDLIVSNPPFFLDSLKNPDKEKAMARHTQIDFFQALFEKCSTWLTDTGTLQLIWPPTLKESGIKRGLFNECVIQKEVFIRSYQSSPTIRTISMFGKHAMSYQSRDFIIYERKGIYSAAYQSLLRPFFINF